MNNIFYVEYRMNTPELLSPVASFEMCKAAVQNGADAIYAGVPNFNARRHGISSTINELEKITNYCRLYNVKVYFACNVLIFESEFENFAKTALPWLELVPDAVILQDIGLAMWFKKAVPWMPLHASTQMTIASSNAVRLASEMGFSRCILARELSIEQIKEIHNDCFRMELEIFVHGALCVSYSGQCNASLNFGGRSANRGDCAQCCRLPYNIFVDGKLKEKSYAYSPGDLCALPILDELLQSGISSLKIEGRLKSPEYVAVVTSAYRKAIDKNESVDIKKLEAIFSRGFTNGWLKQSETQSVVSGYNKGHIGFLLGNVEKTEKNKIWIKTKSECKAGDGVILINENLDDKKQFGGRIYSVKKDGDFLCLAFAKDKNFSGANCNFKVYINNSPSIEKSAHNSNTETRKIPVSIELYGKTGEPLAFKINDIEVKSEFALIPKSNPKSLIPNPYSIIPNTYSLLPNNSPYTCENPIINISPNAFVNDKMIRQLRQKAVEMLNKKRIHREFLGINNVDFSANKTLQKAWQPSESTNKANEIILDFLDIKDLQNEIELAHKMNLKAGIATWQIHQNSDLKFLESIIELKPDFILVRSLGAFEFLRNKGIELRGDFSLNVCNHAAAEYFFENGMASVRPSLDLSEKEILNLSKKIGSFLELNAKFYKPAFHTKHCLFSAAFANNKIFPKCGSPCKFHTLELEDRKGKRHLIFADGGCRNTMFC